MKKIGLYFGTFNPIHVGHLIIANYMANYTDLDKVWLVVSPRNPLKSKKSLLADHHRLTLARIAVEDNNKIDVSNIEFHLNKPSYTIDTLTFLKEKYPDFLFVLIMGEDNLRTIHKWKNYKQILENYEIYVYPRPTRKYENKYFKHKNVKFFDAPVMKLSATFIRNSIKKKKDVKYMLTEPVYNYIMEMHFYEK